MARFGTRFDAQGVLAGSKDANRCIGYLTKYLTKQIGDCHRAETDAQRTHAARLAEALRYQPCSPRCANWLRYGIQPKNARPGLAPGRCKSKAHDSDHFGYAGRRVLASRKWSGKTLADHRADRKEWLLQDARRFGNRPGPVRLGDSRARPTRITWTMRGGCCMPSLTVLRWRAALAEARRRAGGQKRHRVGWEGCVMASQRDELMTVEQILAELCGVSERTFYRWRELGRAPKGIRLPNRELRVWRSEFLAWLESLREDAA